MKHMIVENKPLRLENAIILFVASKACGLYSKMSHFQPKIRMVSDKGKQNAVDLKRIEWEKNNRRFVKTVTIN